MISAFLIDIDGTDYAVAGYGGQYGRYGEVTPRGVVFEIYEANLVKTVGASQSAVMAFPIGGETIPAVVVRRAQAYFGDDFYA